MSGIRVLIAYIVLPVIGGAAGWVACHLYGKGFDWGETIAAPLRVKGLVVGAVAGVVLGLVVATGGRRGGSTL